MTITLNAVIKRLNRRFAYNGVQLRKARSAVFESNFGTYFLWEAARNRVTAGRVDPEGLARQLNLVHPFEKVGVQS